MRTLSFIFTLSIIPFFMDCNHHDDNDPSKIIVKHVSFTETEDEVEPPPPHLNSPFKTIQDWLFNICDTDRPKKSISNYKFGVFESAGNYTVFLAGINRYETGKNNTDIRIEFEPVNMYYPLPEKEYNKLSRQQVMDKLTAQLKDFTATDKFKHSFLANAVSITTDFGGQIW